EAHAALERPELDDPAGLQQLAQALGVEEGGDAEALVGLQRDELLRHEAVQRLPHRRVADPELFAEAVDLEPLCGRELSVEDAFAEGLVRTVGQTVAGDAGASHVLYIFHN